MTNFVFKKGRPLGVDALYYRGETIGLINAALQSPDITTDALEETIAGVLLIVATEVRTVASKHQS